MVKKLIIVISTLVIVVLGFRVYQFTNSTAKINNESLRADLVKIYNQDVEIIEKDFGNGENKDGLVFLKLKDSNEYKVVRYDETYFNRVKYHSEKPEELEYFTDRLN